jgi:methylase of polypeptide subunit release factors
LFEAGLGQAAEVQKVLTREGLAEVSVLRDYAGIERVVFGRRKG